LGRNGILIFTDDSKPMLGGIAEYVHNVALVLSQQYEVRVVTSVAGAEGCNPGLPFTYQEWEVRRAILDDRFPPFRRANTLLWRARQRRSAGPALAELIREHSPKLVLFGVISLGTLPWCSACQSLGVPYRVIGYGRELIVRLGRVRRAERKRTLHSAARVYAISSSTRDLLVGLGVRPERISLMFPGVAAERLPSPAEAARRNVRDILGRGRHFVLSLSRLHWRKGIDLTIRAFAGLADRFPETDLLIAGTGKEEEELHALVEWLGMEHRIRFLGAVDDDMKSALLAECEFFVMPNRRRGHHVEGFGIVFLEAALFGKAVIGGNNGGVVDAVEDGVTGLLVDTEAGPGPLANAMADLLSHPERAASLGQCGRERTLGQFQWTRTIRELLEDLANQRSS
jgi:phosphatidylinositol alpha-1,6-mannosyltransferase